MLAGRDREAARQLDAHEVAGPRCSCPAVAGAWPAIHGPTFSDGAVPQHRNRQFGTPHEDLDAPTACASRSSEFNCASLLADPPIPDCALRETGFGTGEVPALRRGAFRTPGLRNLGATAPYLHDGRFATLEEVLAYYRRPANKAKVGHELPRALELSDGDLADLARFLRTLDPS